MRILGIDLHTFCYETSIEILPVYILSDLFCSTAYMDFPVPFPSGMVIYSKHRVSVTFDILLLSVNFVENYTLCSIIQYRDLHRIYKDFNVRKSQN